MEDARSRRARSQVVERLIAVFAKADTPFSSQRPGPHVGLVGGLWLAVLAGMGQMPTPLGAQYLPTPGNQAFHPVSAERIAQNGNKWRAAFDIAHSEENVLIVLRIRLITGAGINPVQLDRLEVKWNTEAELGWSDRWALSTSAGTYPIRLDVQFTHVNPHHTVIVRGNSSGRVDQLNWGQWTPGLVVAHEIGHMLGAYDEYPGGSLNPANPIIDMQSLMGSRPRNESEIAAHHLELIREWGIREFGEAELLLLDQR